MHLVLIVMSLNPLHGDWYQFWSGIGSDIGEITLVAGGLGWFKHHNCKQKGCWRLGHRHPKHGRPVCARHYHENLVP